MPIRRGWIFQNLIYQAPMRSSRDIFFIDFYFIVLVFFRIENLWFAPDVVWHTSNYQIWCLSSSWKVASWNFHGLTALPKMHEKHHSDGVTWWSSRFYSNTLALFDINVLFLILNILEEDLKSFKSKLSCTRQ